MSDLPKSARLCNSNSTADINSSVRELNNRIDSIYATLRSLEDATATSAAASAATLAGGVSFTSNMDGSLLTGVALAHGVPTVVANPLGTATPLGAIAISCDTQDLPSITVTPATPGNITLTALYPLAEQFVYVSATAPQTVANNSSVVMTYNATPVTAIGSNISFDGTSTITLNKAGLYLVNAQASFATNATGSRGLYAYVNGVSTDRVFIVFNQTPADGLPWWGVGSGIRNFAAGTTLVLAAQQASGGNLNTVSQMFPYLQVRQLSNDSSLTANNTIFIVRA